MANWSFRKANTSPWETIGTTRKIAASGDWFPRENIIGKPTLIWWSYDAPTEHLADNNMNVDHLEDMAQALLQQDTLGSNLPIGSWLPSSIAVQQPHDKLHDVSKENYYGLILAGGRGTRFWPRSRRAIPNRS